MTRARRLVLVDVDRTLLTGNSASGWVWAEYRSGFISTAQFVEATGWLLRYRLGDASIEDAIRRSVQTLQGSKEADLVARCDVFNRDWVMPKVRGGALRALASHRAQGDHLCLLTSSSNYVAEPLARALDIPGVLCNRFEVDSLGVFTGVACEPLCFGEGKLRLAEGYASQHGLSLVDAVFYTDSYSDLPVLNAVGHPVVVHPDPRLRREARRRGWLLTDWGPARPQ
ncbi:MAG: HAD-IB family hydrolase [Myxococcota bacterium]